jgi:hypothetical protein
MQYYFISIHIIVIVTVIIIDVKNQYYEDNLTCANISHCNT